MKQKKEKETNLGNQYKLGHGLHSAHILKFAFSHHGKIVTFNFIKQTCTLTKCFTGNTTIQVVRSAKSVPYYNQQSRMILAKFRFNCAEKKQPHNVFKQIFSRTTSNKNRVGVLIDKSLKNGVVGVRRQGDRIILVKLVVGDMVLNVISAYAPQVGLDESAKRQFWEDLDGMVRAIPSSEKLFIGGDLNGHVGTTSAGFEAVHGGFGYGSRNQEGEEVLDFAVAFDLMIANTFFRKKESHLVTFSSGQHCSQIDFVLARRKDKRACLDCKVIPGECVVSQHKLLVADFRFQVRARRDKQAKIERTKWWKLKGETSEVFRERVIKEGSWKEEDDINNMWDKMATNIRKVASEVCGVTKGRGREAKDTWWWNEEVQRAIKEKKECYRCLYHDRVWTT